MAYGLRINDASGKTIIGANQTFLRLVHKIRVPLHTGVSTSTYNVPLFDDSQGLFTWAPEAYSMNSGDNEHEGVGVPLIFYDSLNWNNSTKVFTVNHRSVGASDPHQGAYFQVYFLHYR